MLGKQAKILSDKNICDLLAFTERTRYPIRNRVIVLLSVKAGLRASEIANLTWDMITDPTGNIGAVVALIDHIAKKKSGRLIPLHRDLRDALVALQSMTDGDGACDSIGARPCNDAGKRRELVRRGLSGNWPMRVLFTFRTTNICYSSCAPCA